MKYSKPGRTKQNYKILNG